MRAVVVGAGIAGLAAAVDLVDAASDYDIVDEANLSGFKIIS